MPTARPASSTTGRCRCAPDFILRMANRIGSLGRTVIGSGVMTSATGRLSDLPTASTRVIRSRSVNRPTSRSSSHTRTQPTLSRRMMSTASATAAARPTTLGGGGSRWETVSRRRLRASSIENQLPRPSVGRRACVRKPAKERSADAGGAGPVRRCDLDEGTSTYWNSRHPPGGWQGGRAKWGRRKSECETTLRPAKTICLPAKPDRHYPCPIAFRTSDSWLLTSGMPDPDRLLRTLFKAADAVRMTPGRKGRFVQLQGAAEVLVAGDLHGHVGNFQAVYQAADLAKNPKRHLVLQEVIHGKFLYPGGGDKSHQLLDLFAALKCQFPAQVHLLLGNHELAQWTNRMVMKEDRDLNVVFTEGVVEAYGPEKGPAIYEAYLRLFGVLPLALRTANRIFLSHSLPREKAIPKFELRHLATDTFPREDLTGGGSV